jgi:hypothetical protein
MVAARQGTVFPFKRISQKIQHLGMRGLVYLESKIPESDSAF